MKKKCAAQLAFIILFAAALLLSRSASAESPLHQLDVVWLDLASDAFERLSAEEPGQTEPCRLRYWSREAEAFVLDQPALLSILPRGLETTGQRSLKVTAAEGAFDYPLFPERAWSSYPSFTLRNGGGDACFTRLADGLQTRLTDRYLSASLITLAWKPVAVYIGGAYWGEYNLRESLDAQTIARHEGFDPGRAEEITILRASESAVQGSTAGYLALRDAIRKLNPAEEPEDLTWLENAVDVDSYLDWLAVKMFFGDTDFGTVVYYRLPEGRWKCLLQDMDYGLFYAAANTPADALLPTGMGAARINNVIQRKLLSVPSCRRRFLERAGQLFQALTPEVMQAELDECAALLAPEMPLHAVRWADDYAEFLPHQGSPDADAALGWWEARVSRMREGTIPQRPWYFYTGMQFAFGLTDQEMLDFFGPRPASPDTE